MLKLKRMVKRIDSAIFTLRYIPKLCAGLAKEPRIIIARNDTRDPLLSVSIPRSIFNGRNKKMVSEYLLGILWGIAFGHRIDPVRETFFRFRYGTPQ